MLQVKRRLLSSCFFWSQGFAGRIHKSGRPESSLAYLWR